MSSSEHGEAGAVSHRTHRVEQWTVRMLCALALLFVGFAHRPPALADRTADFSAYLLPDGTLPSLCITVTDGGGKDPSDHHLHGQGCEACRISASVLLPAPSDVVGVHLAYQRPVQPPQRPEAFRRQIYPPNTGPRAPPSAPILT
jgi:hypothetical protein